VRRNVLDKRANSRNSYAHSALHCPALSIQREWMQLENSTALIVATLLF
jgi:hypothetical protein